MKLKLEFKDVCAIYAIRHISSKMVYVGMTKNLYSRHLQHLYDIRNLRHKNINRHLLAHILEHGIDTFEIVILELCDENLLIEKEF